MTRSRILVLRGGAVGDFILGLPVLTALRREFPDAYIELLGYPHIARLAQVGGLVDTVLSLDGAEVARLFAERPVLSDTQRHYLRSFNLVVSLLYDPDDMLRHNLISGGARHVVSGSPRVPPGTHAADHLFGALAALAIYPDGPAIPRLTLDGPRRARGEQRRRALGARVAVLHPGSGGRAKCWPAAHYAALAGRLRTEDHLTPVFTLGEADDETATALAALDRETPRVTGLELTALAELLAAATCYVGNDCGITHLAAALGRPTLALFGPSDPAMWAPRGPRVTVLRADPPTSAGLAELAPVTALAHLRKLLGTDA